MPPDEGVVQDAPRSDAALRVEGEHLGDEELGRDVGAFGAEAVFPRLKQVAGRRMVGDDDIDARFTKPRDPLATAFNSDGADDDAGEARLDDTIG